ncbi:uncharacterized protein LOC110989343 [Acanthaster planci]|uniref:Uncharacterized protein LOC110989343 n=1 Tax=Acanthaster planci TaxID=133434 RepID=A0A8B7ZUX0_ACAPL|nr:uncharacterized protein LOC110989343 [Acanthaster planci]
MMSTETAKVHATVVNTRRRVLGDVNPEWRHNVSNYATDFTKKPLGSHAGRVDLPIPDNRKNNPHPSHLAHLRRLTNEPVCTVRTIIAQSGEEGATHTMISSMRAHYPTRESPVRLIRSTRFGCNPSKKIAACGIVPTSPEPELEPERLLPACHKHTTMMTTSSPFSYVPRRRKIVPRTYDEGFTLCEPQPGDAVPVGKSCLPRRPRRRQVESAPQTTLQVSHFDGGAPPDNTRTITGRKKRYIPDIKLLGNASLPSWMTSAF